MHVRKVIVTALCGHFGVAIEGKNRNLHFFEKLSTHGLQIHAHISGESDELTLPLEPPLMPSS